jgi:ectoine hydroxylase-related dioxygenase (phytanoyl-CoA dioxygenase family)
LVELGGAVQPFRQELRGEHCKLVDLYARSPAALEVALHANVQRFLRLVFEDAPLLFQSLSFERGSEQPAHQDTAYVVVTPPLEFAAAWIALEDVRPGSGELFYVPGSHRLEDHVFRGGGKNWSKERDGVEAQARYQAALLERSAARGLARETFLPKKGDVLFWSADLVHGGSPILERGLTRKSLVCHYCPARARPSYASYQRERRARIRHASGASWASSHYDVRAEASARG